MAALTITDAVVTMVVTADGGGRWRREVAVEGWGPVEGWCCVEDLVRWAFGHAPVVMADEAHNGGVDALVASTDNEMTA
jgi:hypothetical protein